MALPALAGLDGFKATPFPPKYPDDARTFYAPVDDVHAALKTVVAATTHSLVVAMYGFDDQELADIIHEKMKHPKIAVQLTLDSTQAGGVHEAQLLRGEDYPGTSIAIGQSEHGAIMHMKLMVVDGLDRVSGSTNWSGGGEAKQDNELTVIRDPMVAAEATARIMAVHANMVAKAAGKVVHHAAA